MVKLITIMPINKLNVYNILKRYSNTVYFLNYEYIK